MAKGKFNAGNRSRCVNGWMIGIFVFLAIVILFGIFFPRSKFSVRADAALENFEPGYEQYMEHYEGQGGKGSKSALVMFYAPWCGHCTRAMPAVDKLIEKYRNNPNVEVIKVNCDEDTEAAKENNIQGFPTIKYFPSGYNDKSTVLEYDGDRSFDGLDRYIQENLSN